jgi:hypothetical protein
MYLVFHFQPLPKVGYLPPEYGPQEPQPEHNQKIHDKMNRMIKKIPKMMLSRKLRIISRIIIGNSSISILVSCCLLAAESNRFRQDVEF